MGHGMWPHSDFDSLWPEPGAVQSHHATFESALEAGCRSPDPRSPETCRASAVSQCTELVLSGSPSAVRGCRVCTGPHGPPRMVHIHPVSSSLPQTWTPTPLGRCSGIMPHSVMGRPPAKSEEGGLGPAWSLVPCVGGRAGREGAGRAGRLWAGRGRGREHFRPPGSRRVLT